jgi:hypothetical protein
MCGNSELIQPLSEKMTPTTYRDDAKMRKVRPGSISSRTDNVQSWNNTLVCLCRSLYEALIERTSDIY